MRSAVGVLCGEQLTSRRESLLLDDMNKQKHINKLLNNLLSQLVSTSLCFMLNQPVRKKQKKK